jgi:hypothetical protein
VTEVPVYFTKPRTAVIGPGAEVPIFPHVSTQIDYEVELAIVIGTGGRDIPRERALEHVFGYTIVNDVTARDVQRRHGGQYFKGKGLDGSCPMGPWIVTADAIGDPSALGIRCLVNGEVRQDSTTAAMIFDIPDPDRLAVRGADAGAGRHPGDRHALGGRLCDGPAAVPEGRGPRWSARSTGSAGWKTRCANSRARAGSPDGGLPDELRAGDSGPPRDEEPLPKRRRHELS